MIRFPPSHYTVAKRRIDSGQMLFAHAGHPAPIPGGRQLVSGSRKNLAQIQGGAGKRAAFEAFSATYPAIPARCGNAICAVARLESAIDWALPARRNGSSLAFQRPVILRNVGSWPPRSIR